MKEIKKIYFYKYHKLSLIKVYDGYFVKITYYVLGNKNRRIWKGDVGPFREIWAIHIKSSSKAYHLYGWIKSYIVSGRRNLNNLPELVHHHLASLP